MGWGAHTLLPTPKTQWPALGLPKPFSPFLTPEILFFWRSGSLFFLREPPSGRGFFVSADVAPVGSGAWPPSPSQYLWGCFLCGGGGEKTGWVSKTRRRKPFDSLHSHPPLRVPMFPVRLSGGERPQGHRRASAWPPRPPFRVHIPPPPARTTSSGKIQDERK